MRNIALLFCCQICNNFIKKHQQQFVLGNPWCLCSFQKNSSSPPPFFGRLTDEEEERGRSKWKRREGGRRRGGGGGGMSSTFSPCFSNSRSSIHFILPLHSVIFRLPPAETRKCVVWKLPPLPRLQTQETQNSGIVFPNFVFSSFFLFFADASLLLKRTSFERSL